MAVGELGTEELTHSSGNSELEVSEAQSGSVLCRAAVPIRV